MTMPLENSDKQTKKDTYSLIENPRTVLPVRGMLLSSPTRKKMRQHIQMSSLSIDISSLIYPQCCLPQRKVSK